MSETEFEISPYCTKLRSKRYFFLTAPPKQESDILDVSNACWCARTGMTVGHDGEIVDPADCQRGRVCFEPYGGTPA